MTGDSRRKQGFTLIELITIILLLGVISVVATAKWPGAMKEEAAAKEFKRAIRYAQHQAITREYITTANDAWGLVINVDKSYTIQRQNGTTVADFNHRFLLDDTTITITDPTAGNGLWFNGLGEPISATGSSLTMPASGLTYTVADTKQLTVCLQTGYVVEAATCP